MIPYALKNGEPVSIASRTDLLILDDIDAGVRPASAPNDPDSSKSRTLLLRIINARYNHRLPTLWSSNAMSAGELQYNLGDRILRRMVEVSDKLEFGDGAWDWCLHGKQ